MSTEKIMEQAQVFASAWSVVGGPFDGGDAMEVATQEKDELRRMVGALAAERDALAAELAEMKRMTGVALMCNHVARMERAESKLAELEGQSPIAYANGDELDNITDDRVCVVLGSEDGFHRTAVFRRPISSEPVNKRLLAVATGKIPHLYEGRCPDSVNGPESRDPDCPACQAIAAAEAQQERLLQDMHDAGREVDRVMAEAEQKAVRLTDAEIGVIDRQSREGLKASLSTWPISLAHDIETAFAAKNGIEVAE